MSDTVQLRCHKRVMGFRCSNMVTVPKGTDPRSVNCGCHGKQKNTPPVQQQTSTSDIHLPWEKKGEGHFVHPE